MRSILKSTQVGRSYLLRAGLGLAVIIAWALTPSSDFYALWGSFWSTPNVEATPNGTQSDQTNSPGETAPANFQQLLVTARATCPQDRPFILLGDEIALWEITDYYIYPRSIIHIKTGDPFGPDTVAGNQGGCLAAYLDQNMKRLEPVQGQLSQVACSPGSCLYLIK